MDFLHLTSYFIDMNGIMKIIILEMEQLLEQKQL